MSASPRVLLIDVAGLSFGSAQSAPPDSHLGRLARQGLLRPLEPSFPAVTCTVQASLTTGRAPASHAIIANGYYDRDRLLVSFWEQSDRLVTASRIWDAARAQLPSLTSAMLFWQNSIGSNNDWILTPKPIHRHSGGMIPCCYSRPPGLYDELAAEIGPFNLFWYWGPFTSIRGSQWIARATAEILRRHRPHLVLSYLPHLDYSQQREGPAGPSVARDLGQVDACLGELLDVASAHDYTLVVAGEYGIEAVSRAVFPNRLLRERGILVPYVVRGMEYLDYGQSRAFAMVDHQIAHVFCHPSATREVLELFRACPGIERVLDRDEQAAWGIQHPKSGELVLVAAPGHWLAYPWWREAAARPDFATHVDIHNKPGYDPLELFWEWHPFRVAQDASRLRGSHGRRPTRPQDMGALLCSHRPSLPEGPVRDTRVAGLVLEALGLSSERSAQFQ
ncbi:MAG: alkaline phosphatase family protein [Planctomycetes bacterium]|nr:alkaline phosphatase family protein [Planctomycetota bacterium]